VTRTVQFISKEGAKRFPPHHIRDAPVEEHHGRGGQHSPGVELLQLQEGIKLGLPNARTKNLVFFQLGNMCKVSSVSTLDLERGQEGHCLLQSRGQH